MSELEKSGLFDIEKIKKIIADGLIKNYNVDSGNTRISIDEVEFGKPNRDPDNWKDLKEAKLNKETIGIPYYARISLSKNGSNVETKKTKIGLLPVPTKLGTFLVEGNHYNVPLQFRLRPGAYARSTQNGDHEIFYNFSNGMPLRLKVDPEKKLIQLKYKQAHLPVYPVLKALGVDDVAISNIIGKDILNKMIKDDPKKGIKKVYQSFFGEAPDDEIQASERVRDHLQSLLLDKDTTKSTLGSEHSNLNGKVLYRSLEKLVNIMNGKEKEDNRDALWYKKAYAIDDIMQDKFEREEKLKSFSRAIKYKLDKKDSIDSIVNKNDIDNFVKGLFTSSSLSRYSDTTNPVAMMTNAKLTTLLGEGGVKSSELITQDAKELQNSHMGFLDCAHTPESYAAGVTLFLTEGAKKKNNTITAQVINLLNGQLEEKSINELQNEHLAFPGEFKKQGERYIPNKVKVLAINNDRKVSVGPEKVKYMIASPRNMFDLSANTVPFMQNNQGNRMLTSSKMATQALLLDNPEEPLVDIQGDKDLLSREIGTDYCVKSKSKGIVSKIDDDYIYVKTDKGVEKHSIPNNVPLNEYNYITAKPTVNVGDEVEEGSLLADTNATKNGKYSNGRNLNVAYLNYKGLNYNDGVVISESAANNLASTHLHRITIPVGSKVMDIKKYRAFDPYAIKDEDASKFGDDGIIKVGSMVRGNDPIALLLKEKRLSTADSLIQRMRKSKVGKLSTDKHSWDKESPGEVIHVKQNGDNIDIYVKTSEPCKVGDKLVGRHGNKATISHIIPDASAPVSSSGEKIDILMDPVGVHTRINPGQLIETGAGRIAAKTGKPFIVNNFDGRDYRKIVLDEMKRLGISEKESIFDPDSNITTEPAFIGKQYIYKLKHQVDKKLSSRGIDEPYDINQQPTRGSGVGGQSLDNLTTNVLLSHNARNFIRESISIKNNPNRSYWQAIMDGEVPPPPKVPYEWEKFDSILKGMGVNIQKGNNKLKLSPLTDKDVLGMSSGSIKDAHKTFIAKGNDIMPDKDGLFGENTGGLSGNKYNHIELPFEIPHPTYRNAIKTLCHMTDDEYDKSLNGENNG